VAIVLTRPVAWTGYDGQRMLRSAWGWVVPTPVAEAAFALHAGVPAESAEGRQYLKARQARGEYPDQPVGQQAQARVEVDRVDLGVDLRELLAEERRRLNDRDSDEDALELEEIAPAIPIVTGDELIDAIEAAAGRPTWDHSQPIGLRDWANA
jgi:hypothetical protein